MKPRPVSNEYISKAIELEQRLEALEISKAKCDCKEGECDCKDCPKCGSKMNKMGGCMRMRCGGKMEKAEPGFTAEKISNVNPSFHAESGGQTKSGYFTTNGKTIETEDAPKNKKAKETTNMQQLGSRVNPHEGSGVEREDTAGDSKPLKKANPKTDMRESGKPTICHCGATPDSGCKLPQHDGMDIFACPSFEPLQ
jgi:hypothetical protein